MSDSSFKPTRIVVVGAGAVGSTTAYTLLLRGQASEIVLVDVNRERAHGDALDMSQGLPFISRTRVWAGDYSDCKDADIIIVSAGVGQKSGETRQDLLRRNVRVIEQIVENITKYTTDAILLIATNPVDVLSYYAFKQSGWKASRVIGSGTLLDSARLRYLTGRHLQVDPRSVHAHIVGEHGDTELAIWSRTNIAGVPVELSDEDKQAIFHDVKDSAYQIIQAKGATYYAIALALDRICAAILRDESAVLNVSTLVDDYHGISDVYIGLPCIIDHEGIREIIDLKPTPEELAGLKHSASELRKRIDSVM